ncbi:MAG: DUF1877 family protein [Saprospiraceae bacterium]
MGQSATLYQIKERVFEKLADDPSCFKADMAEEYEIFEKNFEGLLFVLSKSIPNESKEIINQIFYPSNYLGESINFDSIDFENLEDESVLENEPISYLTPQLVGELKRLLDDINKTDFLSNYSSTELNDNGIYHEIWHDDESPDQVLNKRDIEEGFDLLRNLFNRANEEGNYILAFVG